MPWYPPARAAELLKIAPRTLRERAQKKPEIRNELGEYWVDDAPAPAEVIDVDVSSFDDAPEPEHDSDGGFGSTYAYDKIGRRYVFNLKSKAKTGEPFVVDEDTIKSLLLAYSNDGAKATLNEIARTFGWHRATVREVLRALGKTHDSAPITDEDLAERPEDELVEDVVRLKEERVLRRAERRVWEQTKKLADEARQFDLYVIKRLTEVVRTEGIPSFETLPRASSEHVAPFDVFATPTDLHYGKNGWRDEVGQEYNREICAERLLATADAMIERVLRLGVPSRWILGAGSDWFHVDTPQGTTTKGTPQDTDGSWSRIFLEGAELACAYIERLRAVAPVHIVCMAGNHDYVSSIMLTQWIAERYRNASDVVVERSPAPRQYVRVGSTLVGITHGDETKDEKLPGLMANEARVLWGATEHRLWFTGHWHSAITNETHGVRVIHAPSLSGTDRWHNGKGYVGNRKSLSAYVIDHSEGLIADLPVAARGRGDA